MNDWKVNKGENPFEYGQLVDLRFGDCSVIQEIKAGWLDWSLEPYAGSYDDNIIEYRKVLTD